MGLAAARVAFSFKRRQIVLALEVKPEARAVTKVATEARRSLYNHRRASGP